MLDVHAREQIYSVADQVVVSGSNFATQLLIARHLAPNEFGQFALAFLITLFLSNIHRAYFTQPYNILAVDMALPEVKCYRGALVALHIPWVALGIFVILLAGSLLNVSLSMSTAALVYFAAYQLHELARRTALTSQSVREVLRNDLATYGCQACLIVVIPRFLDVNGPFFFLLMAAAFLLSFTLWLMSGFSATLPRALLMRQTVAKHWNFSKWLVYAVFVIWGASQLYPFMLKAYGVAAVGAFVAARNLANVTNIPIQAINAYIPSVLARHLNRGEVVELRSLMRRLSLVLSVFCVVLILAVLIFGDHLVQLVYGAKYQDAAVVLDFLMIGGAISVLNARQNSLLVALGKTNVIFKGNLAATLFSLSAGVLLVYQFGAEGAAIAVSVALAVNYLMHFQVVRHELKLLGISRT